jgi:mono/diheme cytochrome c family protein
MMSGTKLHLAFAVLAVCVLAGWRGVNVSAQPAATPTFTKDVAPIFQAKCQSCHEPGSIAPTSLMNYDEARPWARSIRARVSTRQMPPWHIDRSVGVRKFKNDMSLTDAQIATIVNWVDQGAPRGNAADMPPMKPRPPACIGRPNATATARPTSSSSPANRPCRRSAGISGGDRWSTSR